MWIKKIAVCRTELCVLFYWFLFLIPYLPHSNSVLKSFSYFLGVFPFLPSVSSNCLEKWGGNVAELKLQYWILLLWSCQFLRCHMRSLRKKVLWNCISKWTIYFCHSSEVIDFNSFCEMVKWARIGFPNISGYRLFVSSWGLWSFPTDHITDYSIAWEACEKSLPLSTSISFFTSQNLSCRPGTMFRVFRWELLL